MKQSERPVVFGEMKLKYPKGNVIGDNVLIQVIEIKPIFETKLEIIGEEAQKEELGKKYDQHPYQGIVVLTGPGKDHPMALEVGQHVYLDKLPMTPIEMKGKVVLIEGQIYFRCHQDNIIYIVK